MNTNDIIKLKGITRKGKNRIQENGSSWMILRIENNVLFSTLSGPWLLVVPTKQGCQKNFRWVHFTLDEDFAHEQNLPTSCLSKEEIRKALQEKLRQS